MRASFPDDRISVVACLIQRDGAYLLCRRPAHKRHGGLWEFPGGKMLPEESLAAAAGRELAEELGLETNSGWPELLAVEDPESPFVIRFATGEASGEPELHEHDSVAWVDAEELLTHRLAPADQKCARHLLDSEDPGSDVTQALLAAHAEISRCLACWELTDADFDPGIRIRFRDRMTTSLGRTYPARSRIHLNAALASAENADLLREVVSHELAHLAAKAISQKRPKPHGPEWRELVMSAGFEPRLSIPTQWPSTDDASGTRYEHRCPICHGSWVYNRPRRNLRCSECLDAGLEGELTIQSLARH